MGEMWNTYKILVYKPEAIRPLGKDAQLRWDKIKTDEVIGYEHVDWINVVQYRDQWYAFVNTVMNLRVTQKTTILKGFDEGV
jgi:hypothetical protein